MATFTQSQSKFLGRYLQERDSFNKCATAAKELISSILSTGGLLFHAIEARAKSPSSLRRKIFIKNYSKPDIQITDLIGVRVIMFYAEDVEIAASLIRNEFFIDEKNSVDKSTILKKDQFGYRSLHLVAGLKGHRKTAPEYKHLQNHLFEIQIRTVLEHAWAEIEHETVYKSGVDFPEETGRRFASLAGAMEILGREFTSLRGEKVRLIEKEATEMRARFTSSATLTTTRMCALLSTLRPSGQRFTDMRSLPSGIDALCATALVRAGVKNVGALRRQIEARTIKTRIKQFAANKGQSLDAVSDLAVILIILNECDPEMTADLLPEFQADFVLTR